MVLSKTLWECVTAKGTLYILLKGFSLDWGTIMGNCSIVCSPMSYEDFFEVAGSLLASISTSPGAPQPLGVGDKGS